MIDIPRSTFDRRPVSLLEVSNDEAQWLFAAGSHQCHYRYYRYLRYCTTVICNDIGMSCYLLTAIRRMDDLFTRGIPSAQLLVDRSDCMT